MLRTETFTSANGDVHLKGRYDWTAAGVVHVITCQRSHKFTLAKPLVSLRAVSVSTFVQWRFAIRTYATKAVDSQLASTPGWWEMVWYTAFRCTPVLIGALNKPTQELSFFWLG